MANATLDKKLLMYDEIEKVQAIDGKNINDLNIDFEENEIPKLPEDLFFKHSDIYVQKHHRFSYMPLHTHNFVEFNYVYSGTCSQTINGELITLKEHHLIMMDKDIEQSISYMGENDILVNILVKDDTFVNSIYSNIVNSNSSVVQFLKNASKLETIHTNFMVFKLEENDLAIQFIECLIMKGLSEDMNKNQAMKMLLMLLIPELSSSIEKEVRHYIEEDEDEVVELLNYIDENYQRISLKKMGNDLGYNPNYIGNKLKKKTGDTFQTLIENKRFEIAKYLLTETDESIESISLQVGYNSAPSLFRLFKKKIKMSPMEYRNKKKIGIEQ